MPVDRQAAKAAGYSDQEIDQFEAGQTKAAAPAPAAPAAKGLGGKAWDALGDFGQYAAHNTATAVKALVPPGSKNPGQDMAAIAKNPSMAIGGPVEGYVDQVSEGMSDAKDFWKNDDYLHAIARAGYSILPFIGPGLQRGADALEKGNISGATGETGAAMLQGVGPELVKGAKPAAGLEKSAKAVIRSAYKPPGSKLIGKTAKNIDTLIDANVLPTEEGIAQFHAEKNAAGKAIDAGVDSLPQTESVPWQPVSDVLRSKAGEFGTKQSVRQSYLSAEKEFLDNLRVELAPGEHGPLNVRNMTPNEAQQLKVKAHQSATQAKSTAYAGGQNPTSVDADQAIAKALGNTLKKQFPELAPLYDSYHAKNSAEPTLLAAVERIAKREKGLTTGDLFGSMAGAGFGGQAGGKVGAMVGAPLAAFSVHLLRDPTFRIKTALWIAKQSGMSVNAAKARLLGWGDAIAAGSQLTPEEKEESARFAKP
jgi:hypothetical protein